MQKKGIFFFLTIVFSSLFLFAGAAEKQPFPDDILLENEDYKKDRKGPVPFSHLNHSEDYEVACDQCHHEYDDGKNVWQEGDTVKKCGDCHDPKETKGDIKKLQLAFHRNCKNCHKELAKEGISEDAPFKKCGDCHEKSS
jgi:hypothetical protein